jgi:hypothetical protein
VSKAITKLVKAMREHPAGAAFADAKKVAEHFFGNGRQTGSHVVFKMPWAGDPRINLQNDNGEAKAYQVRQLMAAVDKLEATKVSEPKVDVEQETVAKVEKKGKSKTGKKGKGNG